MKTSGTWNFRSIVCKIMMGVFFATMIFVMDAAPALAKKDKGYYEHVNGERVHRPPGYRKHIPPKHNRGGYYEHVNGRRVYRSYDYRERGYVEPPVYVPPPPVYYEPPQPGVRIFFPPIYLH